MRWLIVFVCLLLSCFVIGCGSNGSSTSQPQNPVPVLNSISPNTASAGSVDLTIAATGSGFISSSVIEWNGSALATSYVSGASLKAQIPASYLASAATNNVTVSNPAPGGGSSSQIAFSVVAPQNPAPVANSLSPSGVTAGSASFTLTVIGSGFVSSSQVLWNGNAITTAFGSATTLTAQIPASDVASAATAMVSVMTPAPGGGKSSSLTFTVKAAAAATNLAELNLYGSDMVWDANAKKIYVAAQDSKGSATGSIAVIDPVVGTVVSTKALNYVPTGLALSDDSQYLYAVIDGGATIQRFLVPSMTEDIHWQLGTDPLEGDQLLASDIQVQPGSAHTLAIAMANTGSAYVGIFDDGVQRPDFAQNPGDVGSTLAWSTDGNTVYAVNGLQTDSSYLIGYSTDEVVFKVPVTASGAGKPVALDQAFRDEGERIHLDAKTGYLYNDLGEVIQAANAIPVGNYRFGEEAEQIFHIGPFMLIDDELQQAFKLRQVMLPNGTTYSQVEIFDEKTFRPLHTAVLPTATGSPVRFLRWGSSGLAFLTQGESTNSGGGLFLLDGPFVNASGTQDSRAGNPVNATPRLTALNPLAVTVGSDGITLTVTGVDMQPSAKVYWNGNALPTTYLSPTQVTAQVPASDLAAVGQGSIQVSNVSDGIQLSNPIPIAVNSSMAAGNQLAVYDAGGWDVVWDAVRSKLYVGQPGIANDGQNGITTIDPAAGTVMRSAFLGSDPGRLSIASDGNSLYAAFNGANVVTQLALPDFTAGTQWRLGGVGTTYGPFYAMDIETSHTTPGLNAFALGAWNLSPPQVPLLVYNGTAQLTDSLPATVALAAGIQWGTDDTALYSTDSEGDFSVLGVGPSTVTVDHTYNDLVGVGIHYDPSTKLIYTDGGQVIDPSTGKVTGDFGSSGFAAVDSTLNRVFILGQTTTKSGTNSFTINSFDETKLTAVDSITIDNVQGTPTALTRWGTNGLAFSTQQEGPGGPFMTGPGQLYVVSGTFVTTADPAVNPTSLKSPPPVHRTWGLTPATKTKAVGRDGRAN